MTHLDPMLGIPVSAFEGRRAAVFDKLGGGVMVLPAAPLQYRSRDTEVPYRPDSELFYLTGATEPGTVAILVGGDDGRFILFVRGKDPEAELWSGRRLGPEVAAERFCAMECYPTTELEARLPALLRRGDSVHHRMGVHPTLDRMVLASLAESRARGSRKGVGPRSVVDPGAILDELRLLKDVHEVKRLRAAAALSVEGHLAGVRVLAPGVGEWEVQAAVDATFRKGGGSGAGYGTIVGSGDNACVLHYVENARTIEDGMLVLVDAGAELGLYQGDITRVYPASGVFDGPQRAVYEVVEAARAAAVACIAPGVSVAEPHRVATRTLLQGLVDLRVLEGSIDGLMEADAHRPYFPHQTSHWIGLDVHDPGDYARRGEPRLLEVGMAFSVEPGLYFMPGQDGAAAGFAGIGVRVEDDVLVTDDGFENLTAALPTRADDVEALVRDLR